MCRGEDIHIRQATELDKATLVGIIRCAFRDVADRYALTPVNCSTHPSNCEESWIVNDFQKDEIYWILEHESIPVGCVVMDFPDDTTCQLGRLAVLPHYRKKGYGKRLVEHVIQHACARHCEKISIAIIAQATELKHWYESLGFIETKTAAFPQLPFRVMFMEFVLNGAPLITS